MALDIVTLTNRIRSGISVEVRTSSLDTDMRYIYDHLANSVNPQFKTLASNPYNLCEFSESYLGTLMGRKLKVTSDANITRISPE